MENQMALDLRLVTDSELVTEIFSQNSSGNFNPETAGVNNPSEEGLVSSPDHHLCSVSVGEALLGHFQYPRAVENQETIVKVEVHPHGDSSCDDGDLEKYKELNRPEETEHARAPYLPSDGVRFLSSMALQHNTCRVPPSSIFCLEGRVSQNVRMIPVFTSFIPPVTESPGALYGLPQASASACEETAEVREAVSDVLENHQGRAVFQSSSADKPGRKLLALRSVAEDSGCSYRNDSNPVVICQLEGGAQILCINSCGTQELNPVHLIPEYHSQHNYHPSDVDNPVTAVLGQLLPVPGELVLNEQEFGNERLQTANSTAMFHLEPNLPRPVQMTSEGSFLNTRQKQPQCESLPFGSGVTKSKKPCNCTKSQCLKLYCECFAIGEFCNNCNCNNCYNNQLHETERFKAIQACLDKNPEAFLPKIGNRKHGEFKPHHNKGCNCKRSECLKNYCECFEAKIMCSAICKCIGCKNCEESLEEKKQLNALNYMDIGNNEGNNSVLTSAFETVPKLRKNRQPAVCISWEEVKAVCAYLLVQAQEAEKRGYSVYLAERMIMEEFGRCLSQILHA